MIRLGLMTALVMGFGVFGGVSAQAETPDGAIAFHFKIPDEGCRYIGISVKEKTGKKVYPEIIKFGKSELKPGTFSDVLKFDVPGGDYELVRINCDPKKKFKNRISFEFDRLEKSFKKYSNQQGVNFTVAPGRDLYLGALDLVDVDFRTYVSLTTDRSAQAISKGDLSAATLDKSFLTMDFDHETLLSKSKAALAKMGNVEADDKALKAKVDATKPPTTGRGEIAMHLKSDFDCNYINVGFVADDVKYEKIAEKTKNVRFETNDAGALEDFSTTKVKSGRYRLTGFQCGQDNGKFLKSASLIRSEVDVFPKDIAYVGELYLKKTKDNSALIAAKRKELEAKYPDWEERQIDMLVRASRIAPYEFAMEMSDRIEDAKTRVTAPEKLIKRSFDSGDYKKQENSSMKVFSKKIVESRIKRLTHYKEVLAQYDSSELVKP